MIRIVWNKTKTCAVDYAKDLEKYKPISNHPETIRNVLRSKHIFIAVIKGDARFI